MKTIQDKIKDAEALLSLSNPEYYKPTWANAEKIRQVVKLLGIEHEVAIGVSCDKIDEGCVLAEAYDTTDYQNENKEWQCQCCGDCGIELSIFTNKTYYTHRFKEVESA